MQRREMELGAGQVFGKKVYSTPVHLGLEISRVLLRRVGEAASIYSVWRPSTSSSTPAHCPLRTESGYHVEIAPGPGVLVLFHRRTNDWAEMFELQRDGVAVDQPSGIRQEPKTRRRLQSRDRQLPQRKGHTTPPQLPQLPWCRHLISRAAVAHSPAWLFLGSHRQRRPVRDFTRYSPSLASSVSPSASSVRNGCPRAARDEAPAGFFFTPLLYGPPSVWPSSWSSPSRRSVVTL
jgi:hypothetical protein